MKKFLIAITLLLLSSSDGSSQWRKIADFWTTDDLGNPIREYITDVYFLDLPGPPRIGFAGTVNELWKTTDGGNSWRSCWQGSGGDIWDICFKDSLTGWFVYQGIGVYRTEDGGDSWYFLPSSGTSYSTDAIHYCSKTNKLFLGQADSLLISTDLGDSWKTCLPYYYVNGFSFSSDLSGIASVDSPYNLYTSDGGITWLRSQDTFPISGFALGIIQPLAITSTSDCFVATFGEILVYRSEDYGKTWKQVYNFGPPVDSSNNRTAPNGSGNIQGDLSRLYIGSDSGMLVSTDEGMTWLRDGGPPQEVDGYSHGFYAGKGVTIAGWCNYDTGFYASEGLWEEIWPQSGVTPSAAPGGPEVSVYPNPSTGAVTIYGAAPGADIAVENVLGSEVRVPGTGVRGPRGSVTVDLSGLPAGTYFVRVETAEGIAVWRVVKE